jgi:hypothetical protein
MTKNYKNGISVVIMAHDRQQETLRAVTALTKIDFGCDTQIVVSDNPSNPSKAITGLPDGITYRLRTPSGDSVWHTNMILSEIEYEWTLLTHDDDEMLPHLGKLFRDYSNNPDVTLITGKSRIIVNGLETEDRGYLTRLNQAGLLHSSPVLREDLFLKLFDIGPLFPASAMIVRSAHLREISKIKSDYNLAGDLAHSMAIANSKLVVFDGSKNVMNYHIHGGNSVFSTGAAGGLMSDFTIVRLDKSIEYGLVMTKERQRMLNKAVLVSRILAKSFHLDERYLNVKKYAFAFNNAYLDFPIIRAVLLPVPLGPLKIVVRRLMWRRIGVDKWGY